ncbi:S-layer homology domain-containing protein [Acidaminobacter sp. JC074]|uniref:S-layer homology domain-containing protein n=1 Tax=Acidaminobacter sp. JC074 TaxID=2530199 RepID=UPI001F0E90BD|nr:S-layer homology domain-containing protein [Acidaminobacter sp. JC074]MCH4887869.1 S-layer homology domain-containing protein [Acidaminobacter sp. JC074]
MKKIICILVMLMMVSFVYAEDTGFVDLSEEHWAYDEIKLLKEMQVLSGYESREFKPDEHVTREEFAVMLSKVFGLSSDSYLPTFSDVTPDRWSFDYIEASKDYLTGYYPYGGKPFYQPGIYTSREDVTVALIRALNLDNETNVSLAFTDTDEISRNMRPYIATAVNEHLISGYEDNTFRPQNPITRAEIAILLHKALKQSNFSQKFVLEVELPKETPFDKVVVVGKTHPDADVSVNGYSVTNNKGTFSGIYHFDHGEGDYDIEIISKMPDGRIKKDLRQVTYKLPEGYFDIVLDERSETDEIYARGSIFNFNYEHSIYINNESVYIKGDGNWDKKLKLEVGENSFSFEMVDPFGVRHKKGKIVTFNPTGPEISIYNVFDQTTQKKFTLSGMVKDKLDNGVKLYINQKPVSVSGGHFSKIYELKEGDNEFHLTAVNKYGVQSEESFTVDYQLSSTEILDLTYPSSTSKDRIYLEFTCINESQEDFSLYLNGEYHNHLTSFSGDRSEKKYQMKLDLKPGDNTFIIEVNTNGKIESKEISIEYMPPVPSIEILSVDEETYYVSVQTSDDLNAFLNGEKIQQTSRSSVNDDYYLYYYALALKDDENTFRVMNALGLEAEINLSKIKGEDHD